MVIPCIDLMGRKVVQLIQGQENSKALELPDPIAVLEKFDAFPVIQVIDLERPGHVCPPEAELARGAHCVGDRGRGADQERRAGHR